MQQNWQEYVNNLVNIRDTTFIRCLMYHRASGKKFVTNGDQKSNWLTKD